MSLVYTTKEAILDKLEFILKKVPWITTVDRQHLGIDEYEEKGVFIYDIREDRRTVVADCIDVTLLVLITVYVTDDSLETLSTTLNNALTDVKNILVQYNTLAGLATQVTVESIDTDMGFEAPQAHGAVTVRIRFLSEA